MKISFEKIVAIVIAVVVIVAGVILFGMAKPKAEVEPAPVPEVSETAPEVEAKPEVEEEEPEAAPEIEPETKQDEMMADVNLGSGGGEIPLDENGNYVTGLEEKPIFENETEEEPEEEPEPEEEEPVVEEGEVESTANEGYSNLNEVDTSKLGIGEGVVVDGKKYVWTGEKNMPGTENGFLEVINSNGQHYDADFELTGNIIGY